MVIRRDGGSRTRVGMGDGGSLWTLEGWGGGTVAQLSLVLVARHAGLWSHVCGTRDSDRASSHPRPLASPRTAVPPEKGR